MTFSHKLKIPDILDDILLSLAYLFESLGFLINTDGEHCQLLCIDLLQ